MDEEIKPNSDGPAHVEARQLLQASVTSVPSVTSTSLSSLEFSDFFFGLSIPVTHAIIKCNTL